VTLRGNPLTRAMLITIAHHLAFQMGHALQLKKRYDALDSIPASNKHACVSAA
jgi:hypothetical protein